MLYIFYFLRNLPPFLPPWLPPQKPNSCLQVAAAHAVVFFFFYAGWPRNAKNS